MWVILQTGYRKTDGSVYGYGTSHHGPTQKLTAVCRTEAAATKWLRRLRQWAVDSLGQSYQSVMIPIYELVKVNSLAGVGPASCMGSAYYADHGREASLRAMVLGIRESHAALRWESRHRRQSGAGSGANRSRRRRPKPETDIGYTTTAE
jgi:hypothetical protein